MWFEILWVVFVADAIPDKVTLPARHIQSSGRLPAKTGLNFHLAGSTDIKMSGKSPLKITYFQKMIVLFNIKKNYQLLSCWNYDCLFSTLNDFARFTQCFLCVTLFFVFAWHLMCPTFSRIFACVTYFNLRHLKQSNSWVRNSNMLDFMYSFHILGFVNILFRSEGYFL